jgi:hypothetical protein
MGKFQNDREGSLKYWDNDERGGESSEYREGQSSRRREGSRVRIWQESVVWSSGGFRRGV